MVTKFGLDKIAVNKTVVKLGWVSFFADVASEMLYPITPIFLTTFIGASMTSVGLIEGVAEAIASLIKGHAGAWSDLISKRKPFIIAGYVLSAFAKPLIGVASVWPHVLFARSLDRVGKGLRSAPRDALLAESVPVELRGAAFGWHRAMDTLGAALGPLLAIFYLQYFAENTESLRYIFYLALIPGLISVFFVLSVREVVHKSVHKAVHETEGETKDEIEPKKSTVTALKWKILPSPFKSFLWSWGVFSLANSSDVFLLMKAKQQGLSTTIVILLYCLYNLSYAILSPYLGQLSDRVPRKKVMMLGLVVFSFVYLGFGFANELWQFCFLFGLYGIYMAATDGVTKALTVDLVPPDLKATALGTLGTVTGIATVLASTLAGAIWDHLGSKWVFVYGAIGSLFCLLLLYTNIGTNKDADKGTIRKI